LLSISIDIDDGNPITLKDPLYSNLLIIGSIAAFAQLQIEEKYYKSKNVSILNNDFSTLPPIPNDTNKRSHLKLIENLIDDSKKMTIKKAQEQVTLFKTKVIEEESKRSSLSAPIINNKRLG
jgi:hypothetical protein